MNANGSFQSQRAPCGKMVAGEYFEDHDDEIRMTEETLYACGCRTLRHEYHDGSVSRQVIRHDGKTLAEEMLSAE